MTPAALAHRFWAYQSERFPLANHGALALAFAASASIFAAGPPLSLRAWLALLLGFGLAFAQFALLRIADEHKDFDEDLAHRPYRAVPRGLVSLKELRVIGAALYGAQLIMLTIVWLAWDAVWPVWIWAGVQFWFVLMTVEFGVKTLMRRSLLLTLFSHMAILPGIAWLAAAPSLAAVRAPAASAHPWALALAGGGVFALGCMLEIARKLRAPQDEEDGVATFSKTFGRNLASLLLLAAAGDAIFFGAASLALQTPAGAGLALIAKIALFASCCTVAAGYVFLRSRAVRSLEPPDAAGAQVESAAGVFALVWLVALPALSAVSAGATV